MKAELDSPAGIAVDSTGNVYVSDGGNNRAVVLTVYVPSDFDHNGVPDLVWENDTTGSTTVNYYGTSQNVIGWNWINKTGSPGWHAVAVADFNGDGWPDIVWQNDTTRAVTVHYYQNNVDIGWNYLNKTGVLGWTVVGAADFNGDGHPDLVWSEDATGAAVVHYYVGYTDESFAWLNKTGAVGWHVAAVADVNKDGHPDLIWENDTTAQITVHYFGGANGATDMSWAWMNQTGAAGWHVKSALDFNGDGYPDLVWQNDATRQVTVNFYGGSNGATLLGWNWLQKSNEAGWQTVRPLLSLITSAIFSPTTVTIAPLTTTNMTLDITPAPAAAVTVSLSSNNTAAATVPATVTIPANATSVTVPVTGVNLGSATIQASGSNGTVSFGATTAAVTVQAAAVGAVVMSSPTVGQNLENNFLVELPTAAPTGGVNVTITSGDATRALVAGRSTDTGTNSVTVTVAAGTQTVGAYVQGLASSGTVTMTANAPGYISATSIVTLGPSGFVMLGPGSGSSFTTIQGASSNLTVYPNLLDSSFNPLTPQQIRPGYSVTLNVTDSNPAAGTISGSPLVFSNATPSLTVAYLGVSGGSSVLTAVVPAGFNAPSGSGNVVTAKVNTEGIVAPNVEVGRNLETVIDVPLNATAGPNGLLVTITSNNPSLAQFSTTATGAPASSIVLTVPSGQQVSPQFYVYGLASGGTASYTASAPGLISGSGVITLAPSGFIIATAGNGSSFTTAANASPTNVTVTSVMIDPNSGILTQMSVASTLALSVNVTSDNTSVGTISSSPVSIFGGSSTTTTQFQPGNTSGTANININTPSGYITPSVQQSVVATVVSPRIGIQNASIGQNLELQSTATITSAQQSAVAVTLTSSNPSLLQFSATATGAGSGTLVVTIPAGSQSATYYTQAFGSSGTVQYTAAASGFVTNSATVTLTPSGAVVVGPFGQFLGVPLSGGATPVTVYMTQLDPNNANDDTGNYQLLAGGLSVTVNLTSTNTSTGTVPASVTIQGGSNSATANFTPLAPGQTNINVSTPAGYTTAGTDNSLPVIVTND